MSDDPPSLSSLSNDVHSAEREANRDDDTRGHEYSGVRQPPHLRLGQIGERREARIRADVVQERDDTEQQERQRRSSTSGRKQIELRGGDDCRWCGRHARVQHSRRERA